MIRIEFDDKGDLEKLNKRLKKAAKNAADLLPAHKRVATFLDGWVQQNFKSQGGNVGGWDPLDRGGRWIRGKGLDFTAKILQHTGDLRLSHQPFATRDNAGIGSDLPYSEFHDEGIGVPQRRTLPEESDVKAEVYDIFEGFFNSEIKKPIEGGLT